MKQYVNWHSHSHGSLLDGATTPINYAERAKKDGAPAFTFTDHGNLHTLMDAWEAAKTVGIKFFPGMEGYQARKTRFDRDEEERAGRATNEWDQRGPYHLGMIAYNNVGYHNLLKLSSRAFTEGFYVKPRMDHELIAEHSEGLVILSGCLSGEVQQALTRGDYDSALAAAGNMQDIAGKDNYFIEVMDHSLEEEKRNYPYLVSIAKSIGAPIIATCDSHYTDKDDAHHHDIMLCINTGATMETENRFRFNGPHYYLKSYDEMALLFPEEYLDNTMLIYDKYDLDLTSKGYHFPIYPLPDDRDADTYMKHMVFEGAQKRFGPEWKNNKEVVDRLAFEYNVIVGEGFANYFLVVSDIVKHAKDDGALVGAGRGSAAGCLVAYCLYITEVDPLKYNLSFDRFLVAGGRNTMPDIDLDFEDRYRETIIDYTRQKYGDDKTAHIMTFGEIKAKKAVRDVTRVLGLPYELGDRISKAMPPGLFGVPRTLTECLEFDEFKRLYDAEEDVKTIVDTSMKLEGLWRDVGTHAAGFVVADAPITDYVPVCFDKGGEHIVTQWGMNTAEKCGLLKIDFLGLRNLTIIADCAKHIKETHGTDLGDPYKLVDIYEPKAFEELQKGNNIGIFQMESDGFRELMLGVQPTTLADIGDMLALYRPGPMGSNVHREYISRKQGGAQKLLHPSLEPYLQGTFGLLLYQDQLLSIVKHVAGKTVLEADEFRKIVGKKIVKEMPAQRVKFVQGCVDTVKMDRSVAEKLFNEIEYHAAYSFNQAHSISYGMISYITAYLKVIYPIEYMTAALSSCDDDTERARLYLNECKRMGISVTRPSINKSLIGYSICNNEIVYGLGSIAGFGESTAKTILDSRTDEPLTSIFDLMLRAPSILNRKILEKMLKSGALDELLTDEKRSKEINRNERVNLLFEEGHQLGVFLVQHPFLDLADLVADRVSHTIGDVLKGTMDQWVRVAGIITKVEKKTTKNGQRMFIFNFEDDQNSINVTVFPKVASKLEEEKPFVVGDLIIVEGRPRIDEYNEVLTASIVYNESEKIDFSDLSTERPIILRTNKSLTSDRLTKIHDIIKATRGSSVVLLETHIDNKKLMLKFEETTSASVEPILKRLIEV